MNSDQLPHPIASRFRGFLPVIIDVETGGFDAKSNALLEIAAVLIDMDHKGIVRPKQTVACHVQPFPGSRIEQSSLDFNRIDPYHPFRQALAEKDALETIFRPVRAEMKATGCKRAILVGHNPLFDLGFLNAAIARTEIKRNPFHQFSTFDTATLGGLAFGQTVLARAVKAAGIEWNEKEAHSAIYDAEKTAALFCRVVNLWREIFEALRSTDHDDRDESY